MARWIGSVRRWGRRWTNAVLSRAVILLYHRVFDAPSDPQLLCVSPGHFAEHLVHLQQNYTVMSLCDLSNALATGKIPHRSVVITFDDGYADNLWNAKPILESTETPATIFVVSGKLGCEQEFWWDELERIWLLTDQLPTELRLSVTGRAYRWQVKSTGQHLEIYYELHSLLKPLDSLVRDTIIDQLTQWAGLSANGRPDYRALTVSELVTLAGGNLIEIGAHSVAHSLLSEQPIDVQREEICKSKKVLESILKRPVTSLSYPYYIPTTGKSATAKLVEQLGFHVGCANFASPVTKFSDRYRLPRCLVRNWDAEKFAFRVRRFFDG